MGIDDGVPFTILIAHSFSFYEDELINEESKTRILGSISPILRQLEENRLQFQGFGLLRLLFVNDLTLSEDDSISLTNFMKDFTLSWDYFI